MTENPQFSSELNRVQETDIVDLPELYIAKMSLSLILRVLFLLTKIHIFSGSPEIAHL